MIKAFKMYDLPKNIEATIKSCVDLGINTLFLGRPCIDSQELLSCIKKNNLKCGFVETVFLAQDFPEHKLAKTKDGKAAIDTWVRFACPNDDSFLSGIYANIKRDIEHKPDYLNLDFIRFFQFWEMIDLSKQDKNLELVETCFCDKCLEDQKKYDGLAQWRQEKILDIVKKASVIVREKSPNTKIGVHIVPWRKTDFNNARENILGQNIEKMLPFVDYVSPMMYHHMIGMPVSYIGELLESFDKEIKAAGSDKKVLVSIQAKEYYKEEALSSKEFERALQQSIQNPSLGVMVFSSSDVLGNEEIKEIVKENFV